MRDKLYSLVRIEPEEKSAASLFLTVSVLLGVFVGAYDILAHTFLLSTFDIKTLAEGYIVSGIAGIIILFLLTLSAKDHRNSHFSLVNFVLISALALFFWAAMLLFPSGTIVFLIFISLGPLNIMVLLGFISLIMKYTSEENIPKIRDLGNIGMMLGIIIISVVIPLLLFLHFNLKHGFLIAALASASAALIPLRAGSKLMTDVSFSDIEKEKEEENELSATFIVKGDKYLKVVSAFVIITVIVTCFIQYSFLAVTQLQYPDITKMAVFLGFFAAGTTILLFIFRQFVFKYILHNYGLKTCLLVTPSLVIILTVIAVVSGLIFGYMPESSAGFIVFFFLIALIKIFSRPLSDISETYHLKIVLQSVERKLRNRFGTFTISMINELSVLLSGLIISAIWLLSSTRLIHFPVVLIVICIFWFYIARLLVKEYKNSILRAANIEVSGKTKQHESATYHNFKGSVAAHFAFRNDYFRLISGDYSIFNKLSDYRYFQEVIEYTDYHKDINLLPALKKIAAFQILGEDVKKRSSEVYDSLQKPGYSSLSDDERIDYAKKILSGQRMPQTTEILKFLRDNSVELRRQVIFMIGKFKMNDLLRDVCECITVPALSMDVYEVLRSFGADATDELMRVYFKTTGNVVVNRVILRLIGQIRSKEVTDFMFSRLWSNSRQQKELALKYLIDSEFKPSDKEKQRLDQLAYDIIGFITWNLAAKLTLTGADDRFMLDKINRESERWIKFLFDILSLAYNSSTIDSIRTDIESKTIENVNYAFEMTDVIISENLKHQLIDLLDIVPDKEKLNNLFQFYPVEIPEYNRLLEDIINRDYNQISLWTKACAIRSIKKINSNDISESVLALLFSPEEIIQEESANLIARSDRALFLSASDRISEPVRKRLEDIVNGMTGKNDLLFEKVQFLSKCFPAIHEDELLSLASEMKHIIYKGTELSDCSEGFIIWPLQGNNEVIVVNIGPSDTINKKLSDITGKELFVLDLKAIQEHLFEFPDNSFEILSYIGNSES